GAGILQRPFRMDFELTDEQRLLRDNARRFLEREVAPRVATAEAQGLFPRDLYPRLAELGFVGATVPAEHGGHGLDFTSYLVLLEELAYCWGSLRSSVTTHNMVASILAEFGSDEQRRRHLTGLVRGTTIGFFGAARANGGARADAG